MMKSKKIPHNDNNPQCKTGKTNTNQHKPKAQARLLTTSANLNSRASSQATKRKSREERARVACFGGRGSASGGQNAEKV
jgi:hypothetical protein